MPSSASRSLLVSTVILTAATVLGAFRWECWSDQKVYGPLLDYDLWNDTLAHSNVNFGGKVYCPIGVCYMAPIRSDESIQINFGCVDPNKDAIFKSLHIKDTNFTPIWHTSDQTNTAVNTPRSAKYYCSVLSSSGPRPCNDPLVIFNTIDEAKKENEKVFNDIGIFMRATEQDNNTSIYFSREREAVTTSVPTSESSEPTTDATGSEDGGAETNDNAVSDATVPSAGPIASDETTEPGDNQESSPAVVVTSAAASAAQDTSTASSTFAASSVSAANAACSVCAASTASLESTASDAFDGAAAAGDEKTSTAALAVDGITSAPQPIEIETSPSTVAPSESGPADFKLPSEAASDPATDLDAAASGNSEDGAAAVPTMPMAAYTTPVPTSPENAADLGGNGDLPGPATDTNDVTEISAAPEATSEAPMAGGPNGAAATGLSLAGVSLLAVIRLL